MKKILFILLAIGILFAVCFTLTSCQQKYKNNDDLLNYHDAPFKGMFLSIDEWGNVYQRLISCDDWSNSSYTIYINEQDYSLDYESEASKYEGYEFACISPSIDGSFLYALRCLEGIGWVLETYSSVDSEVEDVTYKFKDKYYDLHSPLVRYQLILKNPEDDMFFATNSFASNSPYYSDEIILGKATEIIGTKNLDEDSIFAKEMPALEGMYYMAQKLMTYEYFYPTSVFTYRAGYYNHNGKTSSFLWARVPLYLQNQSVNGYDSFDSTVEGWNKGQLSALYSYFLDGLYEYVIEWPKDEVPTGEYVED